MTRWDVLGLALIAWLAWSAWNLWSLDHEIRHMPPLPLAVDLD